MTIFVQIAERAQLKLQYLSRKKRERNGEADCVCVRIKCQKVTGKDRMTTRKRETNTKNENMLCTLDSNTSALAHTILESVLAYQAIHSICYHFVYCRRNSRFKVCKRTKEGVRQAVPH